MCRVGFDDCPRLVGQTGLRAAAAGVSKPESGQAGEVDGGGEEGEVGGDSPGAAHADAASGVAVADKVGEFSFGLGSGGPVVGLPAGSFCRARAAVRRASSR
jgi:hypothetical protein